MKKWIGESTCTSFRDVFYENLTRTGSFKKAYLVTEDEHEEMFNKRKYSGVESFRVQISKKKKRF